MRIHLLTVALVAFLTPVAYAGGFVHNANFTVFTEASLSAEASQNFAAAVLARAEQYRREIAREWLGEELPKGIGATTISVRFSDSEDAGSTWVIDHPDRKFHSIYLQTSPDRALGDMLAHEVAHAVLATQFPHPKRLPAWLEEGIASRYDGAKRRQERESVLAWMVRNANWPRLESVLNAENVLAEDTRSYAAAVSLTDMLLAQGGKQKLLTFGKAASQVGCRRALMEHYRIADGDELQTMWQQWATRSVRASQYQLSQNTDLLRGFHGQ